VAGLRSSPVDIIHDGTQRGVEVALTPRGARALLGLPAAAVTGIADEIGLGRCHMSQLVRAELGLTPKTAAQIVRFAQARRSLRTGRTGTLAETAVMCGHYDQAHLTNDWKQLAGCPPGEWMSQELPFLQDQRPVRSRG